MWNPEKEPSLRRYLLRALTLLMPVLAGAVNGCADRRMPSDVNVADTEIHFNHNSAADAAKGYLGGWFNGADVRLLYTRSFFCKEPPFSGAESNCVIGADAEIAPRPGPIPKLYAVAPVGFQPDPSTLSCPAGSTCLNHPAMLDASRIRPGATNVPGLPHSHIVAARGEGWHQTVNIRVFSPAVWNQIVAAKSLAKVRELQADPAVGGAGLISADTPTNIFFFIAVLPAKP